MRLLGNEPRIFVLRAFYSMPCFFMNVLIHRPILLFSSCCSVVMCVMLFLLHCMSL